MRNQICLAAVALTGCVVFAFAAEKKADPCADAFDKCKTTAENEKANCRARGTDPSQCDGKYNIALRKCENDRNDCQGKSGTAPSPSGTPKKKK